MAQESSANNMYDFMYGKFLLKRRFDITMHADDYVEDAYGVYRDIGNVATAIHAFKFTIPSTQLVTLPCNVEFVEAVSTGESWVDDGTTILISRLPDTNPYDYIPDALTRNTPSGGVHGNQPSRLYPKGEYIQYELKGVVGNSKLHFDKKDVGREGVCIYRGMCVDMDGNPLISRKEADAIAWKLAYYDVLLRSFKKDPEAIKMLKEMENSSGRKMQAAKIPEYLTQNELNAFLSAKTRHDRKVWWSDYKTQK
jgi:hypothetical protein